MKKFLNLKQKEFGLALVALGSLAIFFILIFRYGSLTRVSGIPELLPSEETVFYLEFPATAEQLPLKEMQEILNVDWMKDISPWAGSRAALAVISNAKADTAIQLLLLQVKSEEQASAFMEKLKDPAPAYTFINQTLIAASDKKNLDRFAELMDSPQRLAENQDFLTLHQQAFGLFDTKSENKFFAYAKPKEIPKSIIASFTKALPRMPILTLPFRAIGLVLAKENNAWQGRSFSINESSDAFSPYRNPDQPYRAVLLPYLPPEFELLIAGQNLPSQISKIESVKASSQNLPGLRALFTLVEKEYFGGKSMFKNIEPLFAKEFAFTVNGNKILLVTQADDPGLDETFLHLRTALKEIAARLSPLKREVTLPDGTKAEEFILDPKNVQVKEELFGDSVIRNIELGEFSFFEAFSQEKWFFSNDLSALKKALLLTREPGLNFRDSERYRATLQPILRNPELLGLTELAEGTFGFSKRTFPDHMETNFVYYMHEGYSPSGKK